MSLELEIIEDYLQHGTRRLRVRVRGTKYVLNVRAESAEEALDKARRMAEKLGISGLKRGGTRP
ncbi:MAG: hypothetical protein P3X22_000070 [Thermoprotei archaeon]|nr:hypothetical protein [Thermoprotei archaeon]